MNRSNPEYQLRSESHENEESIFTDKFKELLPGVEFEESPEMLDARTATVEALIIGDQDPDFLRFVWTEYAKICEEVVDAQTANNPDSQPRVQLQIAAIVHKALIFREVGDIPRYKEELAAAEEYAFNAYLDGIVEAINGELDKLYS